MKRWTTVLACALTVGLAGAPMGVYADHHEGGHGDGDGSVSEAAAEMVEEAKEEAASMEEKAEASATDAAEKMAGEAKEAMPEGGHSEGSH